MWTQPRGDSKKIGKYYIVIWQKGLTLLGFVVFSQTLQGSFQTEPIGDYELKC